MPNLSNNENKRAWGPQITNQKCFMTGGLAGQTNERVAVLGGIQNRPINLGQPSDSQLQASPVTFCSFASVLDHACVGRRPFAHTSIFCMGTRRQTCRPPGRDDTGYREGEPASEREKEGASGGGGGPINSQDTAVSGSGVRK